MARGEVQVEKLMYDSIINLRGPSKSQKEKLDFVSINILYQALETEWYKTQE